MPVNSPDVDQLTELPSTLHCRRAILALEHGLRAPILDGNVKRVLARYVAQEGYPGEPKVAKHHGRWPERFTPRTHG
jgi:A/G-specific adenine glycosylase